VDKVRENKKWCISIVKKHNYSNRRRIAGRKTLVDEAALNDEQQYQQDHEHGRRRNAHERQVVYEVRSTQNNRVAEQNEALNDKVSTLTNRCRTEAQMCA